MAAAVEGAGLLWLSTNLLQGPMPCTNPVSQAPELVFALAPPTCRALTRLTKLLRRVAEAGAPPPLGVGSLAGVVQPLLLQMVVEGKAGDGEPGGHEQKQADRDRGANVTDAAVVALGAVAGALPWTQYQQLLGQHLRLMKRHAGTPVGGRLHAAMQLRAFICPSRQRTPTTAAAAPTPPLPLLAFLPLPPQTTTPPRQSFGPSA